jgi:hypothetical protein
MTGEPQFTERLAKDMRARDFLAAIVACGLISEWLEDPQQIEGGTRYSAAHYQGLAKIAYELADTLLAYGNRP